MKTALNFTSYFIKSCKGSLVGLCIVPIVFILLNISHIGDADFLKELLISVRIGLEVVVVNLFAITFIYYRISKNSVATLLQTKRSLNLRFAIGMVGMSLGLKIASVVEANFFENDFNFQSILTGLLIGGTIYFLFLMKSAYKEVQTNNLKLRAETAEANMNVLKNQMQPHFLFNSLNSLSELIDSNREVASRMTQNLSDLYREILESSKYPKSTLKNEISIVSKYLDLEKLRFGDKLKFNIVLPQNSEPVLLPSLVLQTLVENAIKHGISQNLSGGKLEIKITEQSEGYFVEIKNTNGQNLEVRESTGTGLRNTRERLDLMYGNRHGFELKKDAENTSVHFWVSGI
ncbi:MAG: sensor histidine kinase [Pseudobdellovibrio sp.]